MSNNELLTHCWSLRSDVNYKNVDERMRIATENDERNRRKVRGVCEAPGPLPLYSLLIRLLMPNPEISRRQFERR